MAPVYWIAGTSMSAEGKILEFRQSKKPTMEVSDAALIAACAIGEHAALGTIYDRHHRPLFRFLSRVVSAPASDREDLVQCTFIEVWKSAARFHGKGSVRSWIFGIAANLSRHYIRSEIRRRVAMDGLAARPEGEVASPDKSIAQAQLVDQLATALGNLSHDQRVAFVLCDVEEMSGVAAAQALGVRKGTLWRRLHDARKRLRSDLERASK